MQLRTSETNVPLSHSTRRSETRCMKETRGEYVEKLWKDTLYKKKKGDPSKQFELRQNFPFRTRRVRCDSFCEIGSRIRFKYEYVFEYPKKTPFSTKQSYFPDGQTRRIDLMQISRCTQQRIYEKLHADFPRVSRVRPGKCSSFFFLLGDHLKICLGIAVGRVSLYQRIA